MARLTKEEMALFPLRDIKSVVTFFKVHLGKHVEPSLAILSIIVGYIENTLTCSHQKSDDSEKSLFESLSKDILNRNEIQPLPIVEYEDVEALYQRFIALIKAHVDLTALGKPRYATKELVKRVSDVVWCTLCSSYYKDRAHLQSIYSYMAGAKLDSCGTTLAVVAACQALGYNDVHMALSEDHTWIVFGDRRQHSVEVTWHGKGNEDKRGVPVIKEVVDKSWLYVNGFPVICSRHMEVAVIVSNMNPGISPTEDSEEVLLLQQALLWVLYDLGHLTKYPMAIDNLADLEDMTPTLNRPPATKLYEEAIHSNMKFYSNYHVYPYTYLAGYYYRNGAYKRALKTWSQASSVIKIYNYSRDDEEIYKEFLEIANDLIPHIMRVESAGISARSVLKNPECFQYLLEFYDGICGWEEGSATPVLHIGWAKALVNTISKFDADVRAQVKIYCINEDGESENASSSSHEKLVKGSATQDQNGNMSSDFINFMQKDVDSDSLISNAASVTLMSAKMKGLRDLLLSEKVNSQAISLQLTAQSQVDMSKKRGGFVEAETSSGRSKRVRRD